MTNRARRYSSDQVADGGTADARLTDELDGTYSENVRARLEGWTGSAFIKVAVDSAGAIQTSGSTAAASGGTVIQGAGGTSAWKVDGSATTQPVSGTVTANAGTGPFPVSDNGGSITVDAPVATPVYARLSDGGAALIGQKAMSASLPVAIASDQAAVPISGAISVSASTVPVTDNGGSLTVDAPVGTPVFARLSDGAAALVGQKAMTASLPVAIASDQAAVPASQSGTWTVQPGNTPNTTAWKVDGSAVTQPVQEIPASSIVTAVSSAAGAAITLSIASVASQFHYISAIQIVAYNTAARTGGVTPVTVTTSNLTGSPAFTFGSAGAVGATEIQSLQISDCVKSAVAATATTIVCPATTSVIWRIIVVYRAGA
jgi:hypothetical protein